MLTAASHRVLQKFSHLNIHFLSFEHAVIHQEIHRMMFSVPFKLMICFSCLNISRDREFAGCGPWQFRHVNWLVLSFSVGWADFEEMRRLVIHGKC